MLIQQSPQTIFHRLATIEAQSLEARGAVIAKLRDDLANRQAIQRLDAPRDVGREPRLLDKRA